VDNRREVVAPHIAGNFNPPPAVAVHFFRHDFPAVFGDLDRLTAGQGLVVQPFHLVLDEIPPYHVFVFRQGVHDNKSRVEYHQAGVGVAVLANDTVRDNADVPGASIGSRHECGQYQPFFPVGFPDRLDVGIFRRVAFSGQVKFNPVTNHRTDAAIHNQPGEVHGHVIIRLPWLCLQLLPLIAIAIIDRSANIRQPAGNPFR